MTNGKVIFLLLLSLSMMVLFPKFSAAAEASCSGLSDSGDHSQLQQKDDSGICTVEISNKADNSAKPTFSYQWNSEGRVMSTVQSKNGTGDAPTTLCPLKATCKFKESPPWVRNIRLMLPSKNGPSTKKLHRWFCPGPVRERPRRQQKKIKAASPLNLAAASW
jgi:hypothetical protein